MDKNDLDLLWGAEAIGKAIGVNPRKAFHLLERKAIPAKKVGGRWVGSRRGLHKFFAEALAGEGQ
jgi:hypothetical protein